MAIDLSLITKLREMTGAGLADVKSALDEAGGDTDKAIEILRKTGALKAAKKTAERQAGDGLVEAYIHQNGKVGILLELRCETDFVARTDDFKNLAHDIALQIAGAGPLYLSPAHVPPDVIAKECDIYREQLKTEGKPEAMWDKIIDGKLKHFYSEVCLSEQVFVKDDKLTIKELVERHIAKLGEKIEVSRFVRFQI